MTLTSRRYHLSPWGLSLALILGLLTWISTNGSLLFNGFSTKALESLALNLGLLSDPPSLHLTCLLNQLPIDPLLTYSLATTIGNTLAILILYLAAQVVWPQVISSTLMIGLAAFGGSTAWAQSSTPQDSLLHLALALFILGSLQRHLPLLTLTIMGLAFLSPAYAIVALITLAYLGYQDHTQHRAGALILMVLVSGLTLWSASGSYALVPSFKGWGLAVILPFLMILGGRKLRKRHGGLCLCLLLGSLATGTPELASLIAVADLTTYAQDVLLASSPSRSSQPPNHFMRLAPQVVGCLSGLVFLIITLPGTRFLYYNVWIPSQTYRLAWSNLISPLSLKTHALHYQTDSWRAQLPFPELTRLDTELALKLNSSQLSQGFCLITLDEPLENRRLALLYALLTKAQLRGWSDPQRLKAPFLLCKIRRENLLSQGPLLIFRQRDRVWVPPANLKPSQAAPLDFRELTLFPYRRQLVSTAKGASYSWQEAGETFELSFPKAAGETIFLPNSGPITLTSPGGAERTLTIPKIELELSALPSKPLPSHSLLPLSLQLTNRGKGPISSLGLPFWQIQPQDATSSPFSQALPAHTILFPEESTTVTFHLLTPSQEGLFNVSAWAQGPDGLKVPIPIRKRASIHTWRRVLPALKAIPLPSATSPL